MKRDILIEIYGDECNFAVIRLPNRSAPGVVFQFDSLERISCDLRDVLKLAREGSVSEAISELEAVCSEFDEIRLHLNQVINP